MTEFRLRARNVPKFEGVCNCEDYKAYSKKHAQKKISGESRTTYSVNSKKISGEFES